MSRNAQTIVAVALRRVAARCPELFAAGRRLVIGFSGGQDSLCLLHALAEHSRDAPLGILAAHVDHRLRGDSAADAARAAAVAESLGVAATVRRVDVAAYRARLQRAPAPFRRWSLQQAARAARYQALAAVVAEAGADALVVAHTADDQAETVLLNLLRGAGLAGLAAMRLDETLDPARLGPPPDELAAPLPPALRLARPLLRVERRATLAYCLEAGLPVAEDPSNRARSYTRNRVRLELLPLLEQFNPAIRRVLARTADLVAEDLAALEALARALHAGLAAPAGPGALRYDLAGWCGQPRAVRRRLLRLGIQALTDGLEDVPAGPVEDALDLLEAGGSGRAYHLPRAVELRTLGSSFVLRRRRSAP